MISMVTVGYEETIGSFCDWSNKFRLPWTLHLKLTKVLDSNGKMPYPIADPEMHNGDNWRNQLFLLLVSLSMRFSFLSVNFFVLFSSFLPPAI
jgi:hypothetical protein